MILAGSSPRTNQQISFGNTQIRQDPTFYEVMSDKILSTVYRTDHPYERAMLMGKICALVRIELVFKKIGRAHV